MSIPVLFREAAVIDIGEAYRWYEGKQPTLGVSFMAELGAVEALIETNPELFPKVRGDVRRAMLRKFPYGIFYVVRPELVSIIAVMHHARDPKHWQDRA